MATFTGRKAGRQAVGWTAAAVLYDGAALYLMGRFLFLRLTTIAPLRQLVAVGAVSCCCPWAGYCQLQPRSVCSPSCLWR